MSADQLRAAARVLRERALEAAPHPWESIAAGAWTGRIFAADSEMIAKVSTEVSDDHSNAEYIATMHPGVALALADWLDKADDVGDGFIPDEAFRVADQILGDADRPTRHIYTFSDEHGVTSRESCSCPLGEDHEWDAS